MNMFKKTFFVLAILIGVFFLFCGEKKEDPPKKGTTLERPQKGFSAPHFILYDLENKEFTLSDFRGKVVLLNFWASWCGPCRMEMPSMETIYKELKDKGFEILAVNLDRGGPEKVKGFVSNYKLTFPILLDSGGKIAIKYRITALPTSFLLDQKGIIREKIVGGRNWTDPLFLGKIETLMGL